jgi:hypothetical protein
MQGSTSYIAQPSFRKKLKLSTLSTALLALLSGITLSAQATELYMDTQTQQVFTSPGENRVKLSEFKEVNAKTEKKNGMTYSNYAAIPNYVPANPYLETA